MEKLEGKSATVKPTAKSVKKQSKFYELQEQVEESIRQDWVDEQFELKAKLVEFDDHEWYNYRLSIDL